MTLQEGARADLGTLQLSPVVVDPGTGEPVITGILRGAVSNRLDGTPIAGATVALLSQSLSAITDVDGQYSISGIVAGDIDIAVSADGFNSVGTTATIAEQQTLIFSPSLKELDDPAVRLSGLITEADSGSPVVGATVEVTAPSGDLSVLTDEQGQYCLKT